MSRELNKNLFENSELKPPEKASQESSSSETTLQKMALEMSRLRRQVNDLESRVEKGETRFQDFVQSSRKGTERLNKGLQMLEKSTKSHIHDINSKLSALKGRLTERRASDEKIQDLIDRHNQVVQNFESRLGQMQKLINEQEMRLLGYKSVIQELQNKSQK